MGADAAQIRRQALEQARCLTPDAESETFISGALEICRLWVINARWREALELTHICRDLAAGCAIGLQYRAVSAHAMALTTSGDLAGALDSQVVALQLARQLESGSDINTLADAWNNLGCTLMHGGAYELARVAFSRVGALVAVPLSPASACRVSPVILYSVYTNLARCHLYRAQTPAGLYAAQKACALEKSLAFCSAPRDWLFLRHSQARLLIQAGQIAAAEKPVDEISQYAAYTSSPYAALMEQAANGIYEVACGNKRIGLPLMERALMQSRAIPDALRDTLASIAQAETLAGRPDHAAHYQRELNDHDKSKMIEGRCRSNTVLHAALWPH